MDKSPKILVVDDEPQIRQFLKRALEIEDYSISLASDGVEALQILSKESFDLILLDIQMPRMNGLLTYHKIREMNLNIPVIIVTGSIITKDIGQILEGISNIIYKPLDIERLLSKVKKSLSD